MGLMFSHFHKIKMTLQALLDDNRHYDNLGLW